MNTLKGLALKTLRPVVLAGLLFAEISAAHAQTSDLYEPVE